MADIEVTQGLSNITSIYNPIILKCTRLTGTNAVTIVVTIGTKSLTFTPVKVGVNQFECDLSDVPRYMIPLPPLVLNEDLLSYTMTVQYKLGASVEVTETTVLSYGYRILDFLSGTQEAGFDFDEVYDRGRSPLTNFPIYTDGFISFYNRHPTGYYEVGIQGTFVQKVCKFGLLYSNDVANDPNLVAPYYGWRLPNESDMDDLHSFTTRSGDYYDDGGKLKSTSSDYWDEPNVNAENLFGFDARGAGVSFPWGFFYKRNEARFWISSVNNVFLFRNSEGASHIQQAFTDDLYSIRFCRNAFFDEIPLPDGTRVADYVDGENNRYVCRKIYNRVWMCENLMALKYHDGTSILPHKVRAYDDDFTNAWTKTILTNKNLFGYNLANGYNNLTLPFNARKSGNFTFSIGTTNIVLPLIYKDNSEYEQDPIYWLNRDGCWSRWNFTKIENDYQTSRETSVPIRQTSVNYLGSDRTLSNKKEVLLRFETMAVDDVHFRNLTELKESAVVLYQGVVWEVVECSSVTAFCKQNLKFNLTLKTRQYVVSY
mgnify:CR=1 FL=1